MDLRYANDQAYTQKGETVVPWWDLETMVSSAFPFARFFPFAIFSTIDFGDSEAQILA